VCRPCEANRCIAADAVNAGMAGFGWSPAVTSKGGGAELPLAAAWAGADARCPSAGPGVRPEDKTRPGGCPAAPRVRSRSREDRRYLRCAIRRKSPRRDLRDEHPGPESLSGKGRGYVSGRGTRTRSSLNRAKGRGSGASDRFLRLGVGYFGRIRPYNRHLSFHRRPSRLPCPRGTAGPALTRLRP
jgi:hypothetical protein